MRAGHSPLWAKNRRSVCNWYGSELSGLGMTFRYFRNAIISAQHDYKGRIRSSYRVNLRYAGSTGRKSRCPTISSGSGTWNRTGSTIIYRNRRLVWTLREMKVNLDSEKRSIASLKCLITTWRLIYLSIICDLRWIFFICFKEWFCEATFIKQNEKWFSSRIGT